MAGGDGIKLFQFTQKFYQGIGIVTPESNQNHNRINSKNWFFLFSLAQIFITSGAYLSFEAISAIEYGMVFFTCTSAVLCLIWYLIALCQIRNILNYIENCERFIEKRIHSMILYRDLNENIERITEIYAYAMFVSAIISVLLPLLYTMANYYILDSGMESFYLFFPTWWPFDWKTPCGYLVAWLGQCAGVAALITTAISFFNIIFGSCWLFIVIAEDITNDVCALNNTVTMQNDGSDRAVELVERTSDIVQNYSHAKQLINDFNEMINYSLFAFLLWDMLSISSLLMAIQFQLWDDGLKLFEISILLMAVLWVFIVILAICEPGQRVTNQFDQFGVEFERCEWNKLRIEMQRMYLIFLLDTQQPKNIRSYGLIVCTRDTFKQITNKGFSYFMTLRRFRA